jgi:hypothetical protein
MPGPRERVLLDIDLVGLLVARLAALRDVLWRHARAVAALLSPLSRREDPAPALRHAAAWADDSRRALARRLALAQSADENPTWAPPGGAAAARSGTVGATGAGVGGGGRAVFRSLPPDPFGGDADAARAAGALLGNELVAAALRRLPDADAIATAVARLGVSVTDPDLVAGFLAAVGPDRFAAILHLTEGVHSGGFTIEQGASGPRVHAVHGGPRPTVQGGRRPAATAAGRLTPGQSDALTAALGGALATFSRAGRLTAGWLARLNARGEPDAAETTLLGPLLRHGRFAPATLRLLGDALFAGSDVGNGRYRLRLGPLTRPQVGPAATSPAATDPAVDVGLFGDEPIGARAAYAAALLRAIAAEPTLVARFATDHVEAILVGSRLAALPAPIHAGVPPPVVDAWAYLVGHAGGSDARRADPAAAATFVARLGFAIHQYRADRLDMDRHRDTSWPLPAGLRAAIGTVLGAWREQMYASASGLLPAADALRDRSGAGLVAAWPTAPSPSGDGPWATRLAGPVDGARIPAELWADLLGEALAAGGPTAAALALDTAAVTAGWEQAGWVATRGYRGDGRTAYPASPRALGHLRQSAAFAFFVATLARTAGELALRAELAAGDDARAAAKVIDELAAIARSVKPADPVGTLASLGVSVPVAAAAADLKPSGPAVPSPGAVAAIEAIRITATALPGWQAAYVASATALWLRRADDPIIPVDVTDASGRHRRYTGDPRADGFVTGPPDDFLDAADRPIAPDRMTPAQRGAYLRWLASPALVANNDHIPLLPSQPAGAAPTDQP